MGSRPAYVVWLRPQGSSVAPSWLAFPSLVVERWKRELVVGKDSVFWETPTTLGALDDTAFSKRVVNDLRRATQAKTHPVRVSVLFVWDCLEAGPETLARCLDSTAALTGRLRRVLDANITLFPQLQASRVELLLRLPAHATAPGEPASQQRWLADVQRRLVKADSGGRANVTRLWVVGGSNEDLQHDRGITASEERDLDGMLAEVITVWVQADLGKVLEPREQAGSTSVASLGVARLLYDGAALSSYLSQKRAASVLTAACTESDAVKDVPSDTCVETLAKGVALTPDVSGLSAEDVVRLFLQPEQLATGAADGGKVDLKNAVSLDDVKAAADTECPNVEATFGIPATIMGQADVGMSQRLLGAARQVRNCRTYLFARACRKLVEETGNRLSDRGYPYLRQSRQRQSRWREWLETQQERASAAVEAAFSPSGGDGTGLSAFLAEVIPAADEQHSLVLEDDPRPEEYSERLAKLLAERPLNTSYMVRSVLGSLVTAYTFAEGGVQLNPLPEWLPVLGSPWFLAVFVPALWLTTSFVNLWLRRKKRQRALGALYQALAKHGRVMIKDLLKRQVRQFYLDLLAFVGAPGRGTAEEQERVEADLKRIRSELEHVAPDLVPGLNGTLASKLDRVEAAIKAMQASLTDAKYRSAVENNQWAQDVVGPEQADIFPFLAPGARDISGPARADAEILADMVEATKLCATIWNEVQIAASLAGERLAALSGGLVAWLKATGYSYLQTVPFSRVLEHVAARPPVPGVKIAEQWRAFVERAAHPYLAMRCDSTVSLRVVTPPDQRPILDEVLAGYPDQPFPDGAEAPGLVACRILGPAPWSNLPLLPLEYPLAPETVGPVVEVDDV